MYIPLTVSKIKNIQNPIIVKFVKTIKGEFRFMQMDIVHLQSSELMLKENETNKDIKNAGCFIKADNQYKIIETYSISLMRSLENSTIKELEEIFDSKFSKIVRSEKC